MGCAARHVWVLRVVFLVGFAVHGEYVCAVCGVVMIPSATEPQIS